MPLRTIVCRKICSPPRRGLAVGYVFLQHSNSASVLGRELVLFTGKGTVVAVTEFVPVKGAVVRSYVLNSLNEIWSFFDDVKLFFSVESGHFKILRSALALLPFPVQCSINPRIKWSLGYFNFYDLCLTVMYNLCTLYLVTFLDDLCAHTKQAQKGVASRCGAVSSLGSSALSCWNQALDFCW